MPFVHPLRVRFVDTDMSGRIHYSAMLRHFEAAEQEFFRSLGSAKIHPISGGFGLPRVHVECDFTSAVRYDDLLDIAVIVERVGTTSLTLGFDATIEGRHAARGKFIVVCMDFDTQKSRPFPEDLATALRNAC
ncbi:MAG TPA: thioesterase family protein [Bryobacteraceae bacterium]|nr:thioesterase family protein [Bryobacteraceae bacterium]